MAKEWRHQRSPSYLHPPCPRSTSPINLDVFPCEAEGCRQEGVGRVGSGGERGQLCSPFCIRARSLLLSMVSHFLVCFSPSLSHFRGFGFVTFADPASVDKVLGQPHHELDSKTVGCFSLLLLFAPFQDRSGH